jgi:hypothetical protein
LGGNLRYEAIAPDDRRWLWCESLGLWLGTWSGTILKEKATWLRFYDRDGNLILLGEELAEQEKQRAEQEKQRAEQEKQRAEQEKQRAEQEKQRADLAEAKLQELRDRMKQMGIEL